MIDVDAAVVETSLLPDRRPHQDIPRTGTREADQNARQSCGWISVDTVPGARRQTPSSTGEPGGPWGSSMLSNPTVSDRWPIYQGGVPVDTLNEKIGEARRSVGFRL